MQTISKRNSFTIAIVFFTTFIFGQSHSLDGYVFGEDSEPVPFCTAVLLYPADSTLAYYSVVDNSGYFTIKNIEEGDYLLQIAFLGYETIYKNIHIPRKTDGKQEAFILKKITYDMNTVDVTGERIPIQIKKDTIEYNAASFKTKTNAVVEDLLKKLPGVEVDRAGNVKALGKNVKNVLVDGKEFFGNDTKIATKNLPANAIDKVQLYDKKSDEAAFTGVDDGVKEKTINLKLKADKKNNYFGDITVGYGTEQRYKASAKIYKFNDKIQFAGLGMINNINQTGFSFNDYLNFSGGLTNMMGSSSRIDINGDNTFPIDFGKPVTGVRTSRAGGFNFSHSQNAHNRFFMSYIPSSSNKYLRKTTTGDYFTNTDTYTQTDSLSNHQDNDNHLINAGYRNRIDSSQNIVLNGNISISKSKLNSIVHHTDAQNDQLFNSHHSDLDDRNKRINAGFNGSYIRKTGNKKTILKFKTNAFFTKNIKNTTQKNRLYQAENLIADSLFQDDQTDIFNYNLNFSIIQKINKKIHLVPALLAGNNSEKLIRTQGTLAAEEHLATTDILLKRQYQILRPEIKFKRSTKKTKLSIGLGTEWTKITATLDGQKKYTKYPWHLLPSLSYEYEYKSGRRLNLNYTTQITAPTASQLLPFANKLNALSTYRGNWQLTPEYRHAMNLQWWIFDRFSFTTFLTGVQLTYTQDKINWATTIDENLQQTNTLMNVPDDFSLSAHMSFSTPIRKLGMKLNFNIKENYIKGKQYINDVENKTAHNSTQFSLSLENRKKEKIDLLSGFGIKLQNTKYTIQQSLDRQYFDLFWYGEINYSPNDKWNFEVSADVTKYTGSAFESTLKIPLIHATVSYQPLKSNKLLLSLRAFDILNQDTGIQRISELNYLKQSRSNTLGRYLLLSAKYKLNKGKSDSIEIKMGRH